MDSLKTHFRETLLEGLIPERARDSINPDVKSRIDKMADKLAAGIEEFIVAQEFTVTKLKAVTETENLKTTKGINTQVKESTLLGEYGPIFGFLEQFIRLAEILEPVPSVGPAFKPLSDTSKATIKGVKNAVKLAAPNGATTDPLDLSKRKGGLEAKGYAHIGTGEIDDENLAESSVVQLLPQNVKKS